MPSTRRLMSAPLGKHSAILLALVLFSACRVDPPSPVEPEPPAPPAPIDPDPPWPEPPTPPVPVTACERSCDRAVQLECPWAGPNCVETCERREAVGEETPALRWNPECQSAATTCAEQQQCRGAL